MTTRRWDVLLIEHGTSDGGSQTGHLFSMSLIDLALFLKSSRLPNLVATLTDCLRTESADWQSFLLSKIARLSMSPTSLESWLTRNKSDWINTYIRGSNPVRESNSKDFGNTARRA